MRIFLSTTHDLLLRVPLWFGILPSPWLTDHLWLHMPAVSHVDSSYCVQWGLDKNFQKWIAPWLSQSSGEVHLVTQSPDPSASNLLTQQQGQSRPAILVQSRNWCRSHYWPQKCPTNRVRDVVHQCYIWYTSGEGPCTYSCCHITCFPKGCITQIIQHRCRHSITFVMTMGFTSQMQGWQLILICVVWLAPVLDNWGCTLDDETR